MSDYRRFISYLYEYSNEKKGRNCGFARVEVQNGICHLHFQIRSRNMIPEETFDVYGFLRRGDHLPGILLGTLSAGRNTVTGTLSLNASHLGSTSASLADLCGLLLTRNGSVVMGSAWDDLPIRPQQFLPESAPESSSETADSKKEETDLSEPDNIEQEQPAQDIPTQSSPVQDSPEENSVKQNASAEPIPEDTIHMASIEPCTLSSPAEEIPKEPPSKDPSLLWNLFDEFHPFPDDELTSCLRLDIQDLPELRSHGLPVENNPFVLHGFRNYHHLLLAKNRDQENLFLFGVPGIWTIKEQFMANLFGFYEFHQAMRPPESSPELRYGYWCRPLDRRASGYSTPRM